MIKKIIQTSDIHIRNYRRHDEYVQQLQKFIDNCKEITSQYNEGEVRIVIAGDIVHSKTDLSPECYTLTSWFLKELDNICKTIVIAGNHDITQNFARLDPLSVIFSMCKFNQTYYLDKELGYKSGVMVDDNVVWCLYSAFDDFSAPEEIKTMDKTGKTLVALFHGDIRDSKTDAGYTSETGLDISHFDGVDMGMFGHIHKRQCIDNNGVSLAYSGSLIQQDFGEALSAHGFLVWDVENKNYEEVEIPNDNYGFFTFSITGITDLDENREVVTNL